MGKYLALFAGLFLVCPAFGGVFGIAGQQSNRPTFCFVGDALTSQPARISQILLYLKHLEGAGNIRFDYRGTCPASRPRPNGDDSYAMDIRVVLPGTSAATTGMIPGRGCTKYVDGGVYNGLNDGGGSWSDFPSERDAHRSCLYNLKLMGDGDSSGVPWLNHTLHEFGHALGLIHEHDRSDVDRTLCREKGFGGTVSTGWITGYDPFSAMHYEFKPCGIAGNYAHTGLSALDRLTLHIAYPEDERVAEFFGKTVVQTNERLRLQMAWKAMGANVSSQLFQPSVASRVQWIVRGLGNAQTVDQTEIDLPTGLEIPLRVSLSYLDLQSRSYLWEGTIRVLEPWRYTQTISAPTAALLPLM
jgi:hypothetical protein